MDAQSGNNDDWIGTPTANAWIQPAFDIFHVTTPVHSVDNSTGIDGVPR